jgi:hypothetical protein
MGFFYAVKLVGKSKIKTGIFPKNPHCHQSLVYRQKYKAGYVPHYVFGRSIPQVHG